jgi:hypothetical protein
MRITSALLAVAIGYWLGWYYGAILGYHLVPNNEWFGAVFAYFTGPLCAITAGLLSWRISRRFGSKAHYPSDKAPK